MEEINDLLKELLDQRFSRKVKESINIINSDTEGKISKVISIFDKVSNDPNLEFHIRTDIWNILSVLKSH